MESGAGAEEVKNKVVITPDGCYSLRDCIPFPNNHCVKCSHAFFNGEGITKRKYRWEFNPQFGPTFLRVDGEALVNQPGMNNPIWEVFGKWVRKLGA